MDPRERLRQQQTRLEQLCEQRDRYAEEFIRVFRHPPPQPATTTREGDETVYEITTLEAR